MNNYLAHVSDDDFGFHGHDMMDWWPMMGGVWLFWILGLIILVLIILGLIALIRWLWRRGNLK